MILTFENSKFIIQNLKLFYNPFNFITMKFPFTFVPLCFKSLL